MKMMGKSDKDKIREHINYLSEYMEVSEELTDILKEHPWFMVKEAMQNRIIQMNQIEESNKPKPPKPNQFISYPLKKRSWWRFW